MTKALAILNSMRELELKNELSTSGTDAAIVELEEAMKHKTCEWCKQSFEPNNQTFHKYFCEYLKIPIHGDFYCNRYKPKDN